MSYQTLLVETLGKVGLIRLNRPKQLNALNDELMDELGEVLLNFDRDDAIDEQNVRTDRINFIVGQRLGILDRHRAARVVEQRRRIRPVTADRAHGFP